MSIRILKKALGLLIVDIVIIIGIFVLQFRTDSSIIKKIGNLQITLETQKSPSGEISYKNKVRVSYNGINFVCDDTNPAVIIKDGIQSPVQLKDVEQTEPLSLTLNFTEGVKVTFELASEAPDSSLAILADLPNGISDFSIPYSYSSNMSIQKAEKDSLVLAGKRSLWELEGHAVDAGRFDFTPRNYVAAYSVYDENQKFSFDSIVNEPIASAEEFAKTIGQFKRKLITAFQANNVESNITEQVAVSYIAAQAEAGNYLRAVETVPDSVKKSKQRTYLSAPYFNTLEDMNENLEKVLKDYELRISESAEKGTFDLFTVQKIADFIYLHPGQNTVLKLLKNAAETDPSALSIAQISGILRVYVDLENLSYAYASILEPVLDSCIERITEACRYEGNILTISENDTFLSVNQAVDTGIALLRFGKFRGDETLEKAGYAIVNILQKIPHLIFEPSAIFIRLLRIITYSIHILKRFLIPMETKSGPGPVPVQSNMMVIPMKQALQLTSLREIHITLFLREFLSLILSIFMIWHSVQTLALRLIILPDMFTRRAVKLCF